jgi:hypothetical protein
MEEWTNFQGSWQKLPFDIGGIDGTSTEIYRPGIEPQEHYITLSALVNLIFYYLKAILHSYLVHASQTNVLMLGLYVGSPSVYPDMFSANLLHFGTLLHLLYISNSSFTFAQFSPSR